MLLLFLLAKIVKIRRKRKWRRRISYIVYTHINTEVYSGHFGNDKEEKCQVSNEDDGQKWKSLVYDKN